jgi:diguanylate cyclase (GGDEF)-like protein/PAS domain S-box-containing protein
VPGDEIDSQRTAVPGVPMAGPDLYSALVESSDDAIITKSLDGVILTWNRGAERLYGYTAAEAMGQSVCMLVPDDLVDEVPETLQRIASGARLEHYETARMHKSGRRIDVSVSVSPILNADGDVVAVSSIGRDITGRKHVERMINHLAFHDGLTGLANRTLLRDRLQNALARSRRTGGLVAVIYLDLDDFKEVNDRLGHAAGDRLLQLVAARLQPMLRPEDTLARLGGDEFVAVSDRVPDHHAALAIADRLSAALHESFNFDSARVEVTASFGVALGDAESDPERLMANADRAMYAAKARGGARIASFAVPTGIR